MDEAIVDKTDLRRARRQRLAVEFHAGDSATYATWIFDRDLVARRLVLKTQLQTFPGSRYTRLDHERFAL